MEKLFELTKEQLEQKRKDKDLFLKLLPIFGNMSKRGKHATVETLLIYLVKEE